MNHMTKANAGSVPETISKHYYLDESIYTREQERIFYREWQCVGHIGQIPEPGDFFPIDVAGRSIVVVRQKDASVRAFYNVCQHRAHPLVQHSGSCKMFTCPYHAWCYDLNGDLIRARGTEEVAGFAECEIKLHGIRTELTMGLIFVNFDDAAGPVADLLGEVIDEVDKAIPNLADMNLVAEHVLSHECNWKVTIENFTECYHCPVVHKTLVSTMYTAEDYRVTFDERIIRHRSKGLRDPEIHGSDFLIWFIWPNLAIELYPLYRCASIRHWWPHGNEKNDYVFRWYVDPDLTPGQVQEVVDYARLHNDTTGVEDAALTEQVQIGLRSPGYVSGPLVVTPEIGNESENAVAHIQQLYLQAMGKQA